MTAMKSFGRHFRATVTSPHLTKNREPHIGLVLPDPCPLEGEDPIILGYFSHTAWVTHGAGGPFPREKFYAFRECDDDYRYIPQSKMNDASLIGHGRVIATLDNPVLGPYSLVEMNP